MNRAFRQQSHIYKEKNTPYSLSPFLNWDLRIEKWQKCGKLQLCRGGTFYSALKKYTRLFSRQKCVQS